MQAKSLDLERRQVGWLQDMERILTLVRVQHMKQLFQFSGHQFIFTVIPTKQIKNNPVSSTFTDHFGPHGNSHSYASKPRFGSSLLHNRPSPNSAALSNSLLLSLVVLELTRLSQADSHLGSLVHLQSDGRWGLESSKFKTGAGQLRWLHHSPVWCLRWPEWLQCASGPLSPLLPLHMASLDFLTRCSLRVVWLLK